MDNTESEGGGGGGEETEQQQQQQLTGEERSSAPVEADALGGEPTDRGTDDVTRQSPTPRRAVRQVPSASELDEDVAEDQTTPSFPATEERREEEDEEDEEDEKIVLDPEHPLVREFQKTLQSQLRKKLDRVNADLKDKHALEKEEGKRLDQQREDLYRVHEELARLQATLEDHHRVAARTASERRQAQEQLEVIRNQYRTTTSQVVKERSHESQQQTEIASLTRQLFYMQGVNAELSSDINSVRNAAHKARAEEEPGRGDLYVDRLTKDLERVTEQAALYDAQTAGQTRETQAAKEALSEVHARTHTKGIVTGGPVA
ncbi:hypothetical protein CRUP_023691 [Coryphaenoides rupestris]|nr:hypothetical protein CRUP_023691 [Coryphaenoides rupestris]